MKITLDRKHALKRFQRVAPLAKHGVVEILRNICVIADDKQITAQANDTEVFCLVNLDGEVHKPGSVLLPKDRLLPFLSECTGEFVTIETQINGATLVCGKADIKVPTGDPDEFPKIQQVDGDANVKVDAESFAAMVRRTGYATDPDSSRYALGGILLATESKSLIAVGTDGRRLSMLEEPCEGSFPSQYSIIVPKKALAILEKTSGEQVSLWCNGSTLQYRDDASLMSIRLVEGRFPNWKAVIPRMVDYSTIPVANPPAIQSALKQAAIVAEGSETRGVRFTFESDLLCLSCAVADAGKSRVEVPLPYTGAKIESMLDYKFLLEFFNEIGDDSLVLHATDGGRPSVWEAGTQRYVVMPMALE